jgi:hypothetical protein
MGFHVKLFNTLIKKLHPKTDCLWGVQFERKSYEVHVQGMCVVHIYITCATSVWVCSTTETYIFIINIKKWYLFWITKLHVTTCTLLVLVFDLRLLLRTLARHWKVLTTRTWYQMYVWTHTYMNFIYIHVMLLHMYGCANGTADTTSVLIHSFCFPVCHHCLLMYVYHFV